MHVAAATEDSSVISFGTQAPYDPEPRSQPTTTVRPLSVRFLLSRTSVDVSMSQLLFGSWSDDAILRLCSESNGSGAIALRQAGEPRHTTRPSCATVAGHSVRAMPRQT